MSLISELGQALVALTDKQTLMVVVACLVTLIFVSTWSRNRLLSLVSFGAALLVCLAWLAGAIFQGALTMAIAAVLALLVVGYPALRLVRAAQVQP